jgi:lipopolysaccharide heptosyltransferase II
VYQRILLLGRLRIGDCIFITPAVRALRHAHPQARITIVVPKANADLFAHSPHVDAVIFRPVRDWAQELRFLREVRRQQFDLIISFQGKSMLYALTARFGGGRHTLSLHHARTKAFYRETVPWPGEDVHRVERYLILARAAGASDTEAPYTELHLAPEHRSRASELLAARGLSETDLLVALNPGSTEHSRRWDPSRFAAVGDRLGMEAGARILLLGGPGDQEMARAIAAAMQRPALDLCGLTSLLETAAVLERCSLLVSGDTGPLHMAAAMGTPVVALYGPSDPRRAAPRFGAMEGDSRIVRSAGACTQCRAPCLHTITEEACATAALDLLQARPALAPRPPVGVGER